MSISFKPLIALLIIGIQMQSTHHIYSQSTYDEYAHRFSNYDFSKRVVPRIPPKEEQIKVIIDADAKNEIDDQWALALALLSPERFDIKGIVGTTLHGADLQV